MSVSYTHLKQITATAYAEACAEEENVTTAFEGWWLRAPGKNYSRIGYVSYLGNIMDGSSGKKASEKAYVRPVMWITLSEDK